MESRLLWRGAMGALLLGMLPAMARAQIAVSRPPVQEPVQQQEVPFAFTGSTLDRLALVSAVLERNQDVAAARWAIDGAKARAAEVRELPNLTASYSFAPASPFASGVRYGQVVQVSQTLPWPGTLTRRGEQADALADASTGDLEALRRELALVASDAFDDYEYVERALAINGEHLVLLREFQEVATARYAAGLAPQQAPLAAEVEIAHLEHREVVLTTDRQTLIARVNALLHRDPRAPVPAPAPTVRPVPSVPKLPLSELVQLALARRPELAAARSRVAAQETGVELARLEGRPTFQPMASYDSMWGTGAHRWMVGLGVSVPIWRGRIRAGVARATSAVLEQRSRLAALEARVAADVSVALDRFQESHHVLTLYQSRLLPAARDQTAAAQTAFETGQVDFLAVIDAERRLRDVELGFAGARADALRRFAALQRALGDLPGDPRPPDGPSSTSSIPSGSGGTP
jgi:outer membrane protein TolC